MRSRYCVSICKYFISIYQKFFISCFSTLKSKEYIYAHIKERITIEEIADELGVSPSYLSRLFKKETGDSVSAYIRAQKIEMAKNMLRYSDYALSDIANRLSFSSQSHFIQQFKEQTGMTPKKYRDMNHMVHWDIGTGGG